MSLLKDVKCRWASVIEPNTKFEPTWEIEAELDEAQAASFRAEGAKVKTEDGVNLIRFKKKVSGTKRDGSIYNNTAPIVVDAAKNPFKQLIGNGSVVNISYSLRPWEMMGNSGIVADLLAVQVVKHVPYASKTADEFDVVESEGVDLEVEDLPF